MDRVFRRHKTGEVNVEKSKKKFLGDKDGSQRLKHLRILIAELDRSALHQFFREHYSVIFYAFSDAFFCAEYEFKQKANSGNLKELDSLLPIFENVLLLLPEYVHGRWQYNCILEVLEELLNEGNAFSTRKKGMRLFLLWYQILGSNATAHCHKMFTNLVPEFGNLIQEFQKGEMLRVSRSPDQLTNDLSRQRAYVNNAPTLVDRGKRSYGVQPREYSFLVPQAFESGLTRPHSTVKRQDVELELFQHFLDFLVTEVVKVTWSERQSEQHLLQFWFLFEQLKRTYLPLIFPCLSPAYSIYESSPPKAFGSHSEIMHLLRKYPIPESRLPLYQEYFVLWLTKYINTSTAYRASDSINNSDDRTASGLASAGRSDSRPGSFYGTKSPIEDVQSDRLDAINSSVNDSQQLPFDPADSGVRRDTRAEMVEGSRESFSFQPGQRIPGVIHGTSDAADHRPSTASLQNYPKEPSHVSPEEAALVCAVLYGCRQNINLLHDILHHVFLLPISCYKALFAVVAVYHSWLKDKTKRPVFLQEIDSADNWSVQRDRNIVAELYSPIEDKGHEGDDEAEYPKDAVSSSKMLPFERQGFSKVDHPRTFRSDSDSSSPTNTTVNMGTYQNGTNHTEELRGCLQTVFQVMFENMSKIFVLTCPPALNTSVPDSEGKLVTYTVDYVRKQIELCRHILLFFRISATSVELSTESWTTLLSTLLEVLKATMVGRHPTDRLENSWLSNEKLIRTVFQTMNVALVRASLVVPISNGPWDQCLTVYSQLTHWPALVIEWRTVMEILTSIMARLVYKVDLTGLPDEKKNRHGKRTPAGSSMVRARPKSFTDAAVNYLPVTPAALPTAGALSQSSVHVTSADVTAGNGGLQKIPITDKEGSHRRLSKTRSHTPNLSHGAVVSTMAVDGSDVPMDDPVNFDFTQLSSDTRPTEEDDSVSLELNSTLGEDEIDNDTLLHTRSQSRTALPRSAAGTPRQDHRSTLVPSVEPDFFSLRRAASDSNKVCTVSDFSSHDRTSVVTNSRAAVNGAATRASISPDNLSVLSIGSVIIDRRSRRNSLPQSCNSPLPKVNGAFPNSFSPPAAAAVAASLDDDSSSNLSRNGCATSSRTSAEETSDQAVHCPKIYGKRNTLSVIDLPSVTSRVPPSHSMLRNSHLIPRMMHPQCLSTGATRHSGSRSPSVRLRDKRTSKHVSFRRTIYGYTSPLQVLGSSPPSNLAGGRYVDNREPVILPSAVPPTSRRLHRGDTLTADSPQQVLAVDSVPATAKSHFERPPALTMSFDVCTPRCVLAGGHARGWTPESAVVCWRRFLGILGPVNAIEHVSNLERVYEYFADLVATLLKIREHQSLAPVTHDCVQPIPAYVVPVDFIIPILFEALQLQNHPESVKLSAIRILSDAVIRSVDGKFNEEVIGQFYLMLHRFLTGYEDRYIREVVRSCGPRFFGSGLPGTHLLLLDFLRGAAVVLGDPNGVKETPRIEALLMYTNLLCYPHHFGSFESLDSSSPTSFKLTTCNDLKSKLIQALVQTTQSDPNAEARCLALTALAMHCVIELIHLHSDKSTRSAHTTSSANTFVVDALVVLLGMMRFPDHSVALVAVEMVLMLADYCELFLKFLPHFPPLIVRSVAWTLQLLWQSVSSKLAAVDKRLLVSMISCLIEWTLRFPSLLVRASDDRPGTKSSADSSEANDSTLSLVLSTLYTIICCAPSGLARKTNSEDSSISVVPDACVLFPDPVSDLLSKCQTRIDVQSFSTSKSRLDVSSLAMKSLLMGDFGHPWSGFQLSGEDTYSGVQSIQLAARVAMCQILNYQDHFPMDSQGALLNTCVQEHHDLASDCTTSDVGGRITNDRELTAEALESSSVQMFIINNSIIVSFLSLPTNRVIRAGSKPVSTKSVADAPNPSESSTALAATDVFPLRPLAQRPAGSTQSKLHSHSAVSDSNYVRIIIRDFSGKYSWDLSCLYGEWNGAVAQIRSQSVPCTGHEGGDGTIVIDSRSVSQSGRNAPPCPPPRLNPNPPPLTTIPRTNTDSPIAAIQAEHRDDSNRSVSRPGSELPQYSTSQSSSAQQSNSSDLLHSLLDDISKSSPECAIQWSPTPPGSSDRSDPASCVNTRCFVLEKATGDQITAQCHLDLEAVELRSSRRALSPASDTDVRSTANTTHTPPTSPVNTVFDPFSKWAIQSGQLAVVRHLFNQLGFLSWERRLTVELVQKSAGLVRDLKHLDKLGARETHKIAVFYVGAGQEDKQAILSNQTASLEFENFVAGLGWEVDLHTHRGFRGGLERSGRAGNSTPYYASTTAEVIFHVSTRMPSSTQEDLKYKHLGNDEVMIIWTENARAFSRSMLRTQFGDVLIIISPLSDGLFRVEVRRESEVGFFGPIVQSAVLDSSVLPTLVRATAINASRAIRTMKPGYRAHYEERASTLRQLIKRHTPQTCFETFAESLFLSSVTSESSMSPNSGLQSTEPIDTTVTRTQDFPIESAPVASFPIPATASSATPAPSASNAVSSRAGPVAKDSARSWLQHHRSVAEHQSKRPMSRSREPIPSLIVHSAVPVHATDSSTDSAHTSHLKRRSRQHKQHSSVDRAYGNHLHTSQSPVTSNRHSDIVPLSMPGAPPAHHSHHLKHLLTHKQHRHT